jgi:tetratricopeptide (TPR) repeat protein
MIPAVPTLVGRGPEIKQLIELLDSAVGGKGITVFISGEAGVGKTRLVNEFLDHAKENEVRIISGWCLSEAAIPYFPFIEAFSTYMSTESDESVRSTTTKQLGIVGWLKGSTFAHGEKPAEFLSTPAIERDRTFETVVHWADHLSLALLHYLSRKCRDSHLLIVGTYRPEELIQTTEERHHPLEETMFSMGREDLLIKMELNPLTRVDFPELIKSVFHSSIDEKFVEKLYEETEGNPLFALETLNLLVDEGFLLEEESHWALTAPIEKIRIPSKVHEVIIRRVGRLGREDRNLLNLAAVCGRSFNASTLSGTLESDIVDVIQSLADIEQRHRLIRHEDSTFEFTHHKIREVIYTNLPGELRRVYHLKTASCLEQVLLEKVSNGYMAEIALHYVEGGVPEKAFKYLLRLGEESVNLYTNMEAIDYLSKALVATEKDTGLASNETLGKIYSLRGRAWWGQGEHMKAIDDFNLYLENATSLADESMIAEALTWLASAHSMAWNMEESLLYYTKALEMAQKLGNKYNICRILSEITQPLLRTLDNISETSKRLKEADSISREIGDKLLEGNTAFWFGVYYHWRSEFDPAERELNRALALTKESGNNLYRLFTIFVLGMVKAGKGEYNDAISTLQNLLQLSKDNGIMYFVPRALNSLGWIYHDLSDIELALQYDRKALETAKDCFNLPPVLVNLGSDYFYKKDYEKARKYFQEAKEAIQYQDCAQWRYEIKIHYGLGSVSLAEGDYTGALELADKALDISRKAGAKKHLTKSLKLKAEVLGKMGDTEEAIELMQDAREAGQQVGYPPLLWQTHYGLGLLLEKQGNLQEAREHYAEAITLTEATASKLDDASLKNALLTAPETKAMRDAYAGIQPK